MSIAKSWLVAGGVGALLGVCMVAHAENRTEKRARADVQAVLQEITKGRSFRVDGCARVPREQLAALILMNQPIQHKLRFAPGCDLQGDVEVRRDSAFPVDFEVRHLPGVVRVKALVSSEFKPDLQAKVVGIRVQGGQGVAFRGFRDQLLTFVANYRLTLGLDGHVQRNEGGMVSLRTYRGARSSVEESFRIE